MATHPSTSLASRHIPMPCLIPWQQVAAAMPAKANCGNVWYGFTVFVPFQSSVPSRSGRRSGFGLEGQGGSHPSHCTARSHQLLARLCSAGQRHMFRTRVTATALGARSQGTLLYVPYHATHDGTHSNTTQPTGCHRFSQENGAVNSAWLGAKMTRQHTFFMLLLLQTRAAHNESTTVSADTKCKLNDETTLDDNVFACAGGLEFPPANFGAPSLAPATSSPTMHTDTPPSTVDPPGIGMVRCEVNPTSAAFRHAPCCTERAHTP